MNLKQLIKFGIEESSVPVIKNPILRAALEPRSAVHEPRNMYAGGQLVRNTVDGSRPGYDGKKVTAGPGQPVGGASEDFRTFLRGLDKKTLKDSKLADLISSSNVDIKKTLASNVLAEEEFLKIRPKRTLSKEDKVVLEKLLKNKTGRIESVKYKGVDYYKGTEGRIHTKGSLKADRPEAYKKVLSTLREHRGIIKSKNVFPAPGDDLKKAIWRDLYESTRKREYTKQAGKYEVPEPRLKLVSRPDNLTVSSVEDIILLDTKTNKKINYKNLERYVDSLPNTSYKDLELPYKYKNWLTDQTITYKGKTNVALRTVLRENLLTEGQLTNWRNSPYQVHHPFGINENPFKTQLAMHTANGKEGWIRLDTLKKLDAAGTDEKQIKKIMNSFKKKIKALPGGIQSGIGDELIGKALKPDEFMKTLFSKAKIGREARPLIKDFLKTYQNAGIGKNCPVKKAEGGRISFGAGGYDDCMKNAIQEHNKNLQSENPTVRNKARSKQFNINKSKNMKSILELGGKGINRALRFGKAWGAEWEPVFEGAFYEWARRKGYTHDQAKEETFFYKMLDPKRQTGIFEGAEPLLEKELYEIKGENEFIDVDNRPPMQDPEFGKVIGERGTVKRYIDNEKALMAARQKYNQLYNDYNIARTGRERYPEKAEAYAKAMEETWEEMNMLEDKLDLDRDSYQAAVEKQEHIQGIRALEYGESGSGDTEKLVKQREKRRQREMEDKFPDYTKSQLDKILKTSGYTIDPNIAKYKKDLKFLTKEDIPTKYQPAFPPGLKAKPVSTHDRIRGILSGEDKLRYYADNFRTEKAEGGIMNLKKW